VSLDACAGRRKIVDQPSVGRVEVTDEQVRPPAMTGERRGATIGGDNEVGPLEPALVAWRELAGCHDHRLHRSSMGLGETTSGAPAVTEDREGRAASGLLRLPSPA
jgi:hypothetical protein